MAGGQVQLVTVGVSDIYLTGTPEITFWKLVYRRHTPFALDSVRCTFDGTADFGRQASATIGRNGDLLGAMWLEVTLPDLLTYDVTPTPPDGNSIDATSSAAGLYVDPAGNYWQDLQGGLYRYPVAFLKAGKYYATATVTSGATTQTVVSFNGTAYGGSSVTGSTVAVSDELTTWPYLCRTGLLGVPYTWSTPSHQVRYVNSVGHALLRSVELQIGGQRIDRHYGEWLDVWSELTEKEEKRAGMWAMVGKYSDADYASGWTRAQSRARKLYIPLKFAFNTAPGLYLPLVALQYSPVMYNFEFRPYLECVRSAVPLTALTTKAGGETLKMTDCELWADFVLLDSPERNAIAAVPHERLFTQLQFLGDEAIPAPSDPNGTRSRKLALNYSHPVKELVWVYTAKSNYEVDPVAGNAVLDYGVPGDEDAEIFDDAKVVINGQDRFASRAAPYFRLVQPYAHHTRVPSKKVHCYSFSLLNVEEVQPSGTANFSRFDSASLNLTLNADLPVGKMKIFAQSFNVLKIQNGAAGLAFPS